MPAARCVGDEPACRAEPARERRSAQQRAHEQHRPAGAPVGALVGSGGRDGGCESRLGAFAVPVSGTDRDGVGAGVEVAKDGLCLGRSGAACRPDAVTVTWTAPADGGAPAQYVIRLKTPGRGKAKIKRVNAEAATVTFGNVKAGTHTVYVRAKNAAGGGKWAKTQITVP